MNIKCIIIDDEKRSRVILVRFLAKYCPEVEVIGEAENVKQACDLISTAHPDLVFLDISLPGESGFDLLEKYDPPGFEVIFVTAHDEYAIKAIKSNAADYLVKPISITELKESVGRVAQRIKAKKAPAPGVPAGLQKHAAQPNGKITVPVKDGFLYIDKLELVRCEADGGYTWLHFKNKEKVMVTRTLGEFEDILPASEFVRVHHHHMINLHHVTQYNQGRGGHVVMSDKAVIAVSRRKKQDFLEKLGAKE